MWSLPVGRVESERVCAYSMRSIFSSFFNMPFIENNKPCCLTQVGHVMHVARRTGAGEAVLVVVSVDTPQGVPAAVLAAVQ